jgi:hypothetical protein
MPIFTKVMWNRWSSILHPRTAILLGVLSFCRPALCQEVSAALLQPPAMQPSAFTPTPAITTVQPTTLPEAPSHRFWDRENTFLFASAAAFNAADFVVTRDNLRGGGQELNPVTRVFTGSTPMLVMNFAGETAGVVALSYFFHKTGHHKLERFVSMTNIGSSAGAVTYDLVHR